MPDQPHTDQRNEPIQALSQSTLLEGLLDIAERLESDASFWEILYKGSDRQLKEIMKDSDRDYPNAVTRFRGICRGRWLETTTTAQSIRKRFLPSNAED